MKKKKKKPKKKNLKIKVKKSKNKSKSKIKKKRPKLKKKTTKSLNRRKKIKKVKLKTSTEKLQSILQIEDIETSTIMEYSNSLLIKGRKNRSYLFPDLILSVSLCSYACHPSSNDPFSNRS